MRTTIITVLLATPLLIAAATAQAAFTCSQEAGFCMKKGGSQAVCYDASRMASCKSTGQYVGPSGRTWPATKEK
jgi:hypothetical protein